MTYAGSPLEKMDIETRKRVSSWIWKQNATLAHLDDGQTAPIPFLIPDIIENCAQQPPLTIEQRIDRALQAIGRPPNWMNKTQYPVGNFSILDQMAKKQFLFLAATECGLSYEDFGWLLSEMTDAGLVRLANPGDAMCTQIVLTLQGLNRLETGGVPLASRTAFVAMWFNPDVTEAYERGIMPAIEEVGYTPMRIDRKDHANKIDDEIVAEIRRSRFLVCDFTCGMGKDSEDTATAIARGGVYYEAGR